MSIGSNTLFICNFKRLRPGLDHVVIAAEDGNRTYRITASPLGDEEMISLIDLGYSEVASRILVHSSGLGPTTEIFSVRPEVYAHSGVLDIIPVDRATAKHGDALILGTIQRFDYETRRR